MSDVQCPATLLISRHGDATYHHHGVMSDDGGWLTETGRLQAEAMAHAVRAQRIAAVYTSTMNRAIETGEIVAKALGVRSTSVPGLQEFAVGDLAGLPFGDPAVQQIFDGWLQGDLDVGCPGGESGWDVMHRYEPALSDIADLHRGETVVVISHGGVMSLCLPRLADNTPNDLAKQRFLPNCVPAEMRSDADGWVLIEWPGSTDRSVV